MPAAAARRVRATVLSAPSGAGGPPGYRIPPPSLDMLDTRELRVPRRPSDNRRRGDGPCPRLYGEGLELSTFASVRAESVGAVYAEPSFQLSPHALVDASSGQLTACLVARALAGITPDAPLRCLWLATGEVADEDGFVASAAVLPVALVGYKAQLAAALLRRLTLDHPDAVLRVDGVAMAPMLVAADQDLEDALAEIRLLRAREGPGFWPFEVEPVSDGWCLRLEPGGPLLVKLVFLRVATVAEAEEALTEWHAMHQPPDWVEPEPSTGAHTAGAWTAGLLAAAAVVGGVVYDAASTAPVGGASSTEPASTPMPTPSFDLAPGSRESREPGSREPGSREPGSREPGSREPGSREPGSREPGSRSGAADVAPPIEPVPPSPIRPERVPKRRRSGTAVGAVTPSERVAPPPEVSTDGRHAAVPPERTTSRPRSPEPEAPSNPLPTIRVYAPDGREVPSERADLVRDRIEACIDQEVCRPDGGHLEVKLIENLASLANPILEIRGRRCTLVRVSSCFR